MASSPYLTPELKQYIKDNRVHYYIYILSIIF